MDIEKDEAERKQRGAEQASAAAQARADQAEAEVARLRGIVEGIESLRPQAVDIMATLQTARVRVETDACQASKVLADLKTTQDKMVAILNQVQAGANEASEAAVRAKSEADAAKQSADEAQDQAGVADRATDAVKMDAGFSAEARVKAQTDADAIGGLRAKAEQNAKSEMMKSWLGVILAALALVVAIGAVAAFYHFSHTHSPSPQPAVVVPVQPGQTPAPPVAQPPAPTTTPQPFLVPADKPEFMRICQGNGLSDAECAAAWDRYTK